MGLKQVSYTDEEGRIKAVMLPESSSEDEAQLRGIPIGPPSLEELGLPKEIEVALNNELFHRGILTPRDALKRRPEIMSALQAALRLDSEKVFVAYVGRDFRNARTKSPEGVADKVVRNRGQSQPRQRAGVSGAGSPSWT